MNNFEPFSTSRIVSIVNDFGYEIYKDDELKLIEDPNKGKKFSGNGIEKKTINSIFLLLLLNLSYKNYNSDKAFLQLYQYF